MQNLSSLIRLLRVERKSNLMYFLISQKRFCAMPCFAKSIASVLFRPQHLQREVCHSHPYSSYTAVQQQGMTPVPHDLVCRDVILLLYPVDHGTSTKYIGLRSIHVTAEIFQEHT